LVHHQTEFSDLAACYALLGLPPGGTMDEAKHAFRQRAMRLHPDVNRSWDATQTFQALNQAFQQIVAFWTQQAAGMHKTEPTFQEMTVSKKSRAGYTSIGDALRDAQPHARIHVFPGIYRESLILNQPVELVARGAPEETIVTSRLDHCLHMLAPQAMVRGLTLRAQYNRQKNGHFALVQTQGNLSLEGCDICSEALSGVVVHGHEAVITLRDSKIHACGQAGVFLYDGAKANLRRCEIAGNLEAGVHIEENAQATLDNCQIIGGRKEGLVVADHGYVILQNCDLLHNQCGNVRIGEHGTLYRMGINTFASAAV
jgi:F-box protein 11